jgi:hypothetical protein
MAGVGFYLPARFPPIRTPCHLRCDRLPFPACQTGFTPYLHPLGFWQSRACDPACVMRPDVCRPARRCLGMSDGYRHGFPARTERHAFSIDFRHRRSSVRPGRKVRREKAPLPGLLCLPAVQRRSLPHLPCGSSAGGPPSPSKGPLSMPQVPSRLHRRLILRS